jgi:NADH-quinone oxidoreductase subunit N
MAASLLHIATFLVAATGLTAVLVHLERRGRAIEHFEDLSGLVSREPVAAGCAAICLLSLAGVPPFPGFWGKLFVLASGLSTHIEPRRGFLPHPNAAMQVVAIVAVVSMAMSAAAWFRILSAMFLDTPVARPAPARVPAPLPAGIAAAVLVLVAGLFPGTVLGTVAVAPRVVVENQPAKSKPTARANRKVPDAGSGTDTPAPRERSATGLP